MCGARGWGILPQVKSLPLDAVLDEVRQFGIDGEHVDLRPHHRGHIHDTFISTWKQEEGERRYLHQRLNDKVFTDIPALMHNVRRVTDHLAERARSGLNGHGFHTLQLVPTRTGRSFLAATSGPWRTYEYVENTESYDQCASPEQAYDAALAFGDFQAQLIDIEVEQLRETIPAFFHSPTRLRRFEDTLASDPRSRAAIAEKEIRFARTRHPMVHVIDRQLKLGAIPLRVVHGDTKLNNVLFDRTTGKPVCIVDLDTCMPAYSLYDFGDLVRFTAATSSEDERDLERAGTDLALYRALVDGYREGTADLLTPLEVELMPFAARLVTFTIGLRFLTDFLAGDVYFKVADDRPEQNLDRARVQFRMVEFMERHERELAVT